MPASALVLVVASAGLHVFWNAILKVRGDRLVVIWLQSLAAAVALAPVLAVRGIDADALPHVLASGAVHAVYALALIAAYERADLSVAYPVARGTAPVLLAGSGLVIFGEDIGLTGWLGVVLISAAAIALARRSGPLHHAGFAFATGVLIATYTTIDTAGARAAGEAVAYTDGIFWGLTVALLPVVVARHGRDAIVATVRDRGHVVAAAGVASIAAYVLVLGAVRIAPVGPVAAVRETSVVLGALVGSTVLREGDLTIRAIWAAIVAAGVVLVAL